MKSTVSRIAFAALLGATLLPSIAGAEQYRDDTTTWQEDVTEWLWEHLPRTMEGFKLFQDWLAQLDTIVPPPDTQQPPEDVPHEPVPPPETVSPHEPVPPPERLHNPVPPPENVPPEEKHGSGADWYIDNTASGGDASSWGTAWKSFKDVDWNKVKPGDTIHVSGGAGGETYNGEMRVTASGDPDNPIIIEAATETGHNGVVTAYVDGTDQAAFFLQNVSNIVIRGFTITTATNTELQTDGIYLQSYGDGEDTKNIVIENNKIIISNNGDDHNDCIQTSWRVTDLTVRNNYCEQRNNKQEHAQGFWLTGANGTFTVTGNSVYLPNSDNTLTAVMPTTDERLQYDNKVIAYITNNTFVGGGWATIWISAVPDATIKNNKVLNSQADAIAIRLDSDDPPPENIDNNTYTGSPTFHYHKSDYISLQEWQAKGYDKNSTVSNQVPNSVDSLLSSQTPEATN